MENKFLNNAILFFYMRYTYILNIFLKKLLKIIYNKYFKCRPETFRV